MAHPSQGAPSRFARSHTRAREIKGGNLRRVAVCLNAVPRIHSTMPSLSFQTPIPDIAFAKPKTLGLGVASYETPTWAKVLEEAARAMLEGARTRKAALAAAKRFSWMGRSGRGMARPCELEPGVWIELHQGSHGILVRTKMLLDACGYPLDLASLEYEELLRGESSRRERGERRVPRKEVARKVREVRKEDKMSRPAGSSKLGNGERPGAYAKRLFAKAFHENLVPKEDFFACLDDKEGTKRVFGLVLGGRPLFSRCVMMDGEHHRSWTEPFATPFGFPVFINSQWRDQHLGKLRALLARWGVDVEDIPSAKKTKKLQCRGSQGNEEFIQRTLFDLELREPPASSRNQTHQKQIPSGPEKIGAYAKRTLYAALSEGRVPDDDFKQLNTYNGTVALLGISLSRCPLFSTKPIITNSGIHSWSDPIQRNGRPVFVCMEWYEYHRSKLDVLLARWTSKPESVEPASCEKIGTFAKRELFQALVDGRVPDDDFELLSTIPGTKSLLGLPLKGCPLFSSRPYRKGSQLRTWAESAKRNGKAVFVNKGWFNRSDEWAKLKKLLSRWDKKNMPGKKDLPTQIEEFYDGVFSSDDFWEYAAEIYGLDTTPAAKAAQIRCLVQRFIRLDRDHWISVPNFKRLSDWDMAKESSVASILNSALGSAPFLPIASISENVLSALPILRLDGKTLSWTRELVAAIAALLIPSVHIANHGVVPQTLTALLVQACVPDEAVLDMALAAYCNRNPSNRTVDDAFAFLRDNYVRSRLTDNLKTEIRNYLSSHVGQDEISPPTIIAPSVKQPAMPDNSDENEKLLDDWANGAL